MKPKSVVVYLVLGVVGAVVIVGLLSGFISLGNIAANFLSFVLTIIVISVLAVIGALFIGMAVSHYITERRGFTPFEEEMLRMKVEVEDIKQRVERIEKTVESIAEMMGDGRERK